MEERNVMKCATCGTINQLLRCAKCKTVFYCSTSHQHSDWPRHKQECRTLAKRKNDNKMQLLQLQQAVASTSLGTNVETTQNSKSTKTAVENGFTKAVHQQQQQSDYTLLGSHENEILHTKAEVCNASNNLKHAYHHPHHSNIVHLQENSELMQQMHIGSTHSVVSSSCDNDSSYYLGARNNTTQTQPLSRVEDVQQQQSENLEFLTQFSTHANNQLEKSSSYQIGHVDVSQMGNVNERRYEDLCRNIINDMNEYGLSVVDDFLGVEKGLQILNEVHCMYSAGVFKDGQLVNNARADQDLKTIRGDKITWIKGVEPNCSNVGYLINQIDNVICRANAMKNNGKLGQYKVKERTKAMVACYPGSGSQYVMHVDNPNKDGRVITAIYYLNLNWNTEQSGGLLRIFPEHCNTVADIEPIFDRLIFFWSDKRNPHEVQPAHRTRYAITVWYFDANERELALNRCKYVNNKVTEQPSATTTSTSKAAESEDGEIDTKVLDKEMSITKSTPANNNIDVTINNLCAGSELCT